MATEIDIANSLEMRERAHTVDDIDKTIDAVDGALDIYARALQDGVEKHLVGGPTKPAIRRYT